MKHWIQAFRLRTLPLCLSGIILGSFIAYSQGHFNLLIFTFACLTTALFQILSNLANDYGDGIKGTDNDNRVGPERAIQSGAISPKAMKKGMIFFVILSLISALILIYISFDQWLYALLFLGLGIASIIAAIKYTVGSSAYGYRGLGDLFVFLFFGLLAVIGTSFLFHPSFSWDIVLPAIAIGSLSTAVLNLNNMRDIENDEASKKYTLVVKMGLENAKKYHQFLILLPFLCAISYLAIHEITHYYLMIIPFLPLFLHLKRVQKISTPRLFDPELKKVALSTLLFAITLGVSLII